MFKDLCDHLGPPWMIQDTLPILRSLPGRHLLSLFCCVRHRVEVLEVRRVLRTITLPTTGSGGWDRSPDRQEVIGRSRSSVPGLLMAQILSPPVTAIGCTL